MTQHHRPPRITAHLITAGEPGAHVEFDARPGTPLGGPFTTGPFGPPDVTRVAESDFTRLHFAYLRAAYQKNPEVRRQLDQLAGLSVYSDHRIAMVARNVTAARSVIEAATRLARKLPRLEDRA